MVFKTTFGQSQMWSQYGNFTVHLDDQIKILKICKDLPECMEVIGEILSLNNLYKCLENDSGHYLEIMLKKLSQLNDAPSPPHCCVKDV